MMGDIYQRDRDGDCLAQQGLSDTNLAIKVLNTLARVLFEKRKEMQNISTTEYATYKAIGVDVIDGKQVKCLTRFLGRR